MSRLVQKRNVRRPTLSGLGTEILPAANHRSKVTRLIPMARATLSVDSGFILLPSCIVFQRVCQAKSVWRLPLVGATFGTGRGKLTTQAVVSPALPTCPISGQPQQ